LEFCRETFENPSKILNQFNGGVLLVIILLRLKVFFQKEKEEKKSKVFLAQLTHSSINFRPPPSFPKKEMIKIN